MSSQKPPIPTISTKSRGWRFSSRGNLLRRGDPPGWGILLLWLLTLGFPALFVRSTLLNWLEWQEDHLEHNTRQKLREDMKSYQIDLETIPCLEKAVGRVARELGFIDAASPKLQEKFLGAGDDFFDLLKRRIEEETGSPVMGLILVRVGSSSRKLWMYRHPELEKEAPIHLLPRGLKTLTDRLGMMNSPPKSRRAEYREYLRTEDQAKKIGQRLFPRNFNALTVGRKISRFSFSAPVPGIGYQVSGWIDRKLPKDYHFTDPLCYFTVIFHHNYLNVPVLVRKTGQNQPGTTRFFLQDSTGVSLPAFCRTPEDQLYLHDPPPFLTPEVMQRAYQQQPSQKAVPVAPGAEIALAASVPVAALVHPMRVVLPLCNGLLAAICALGLYLAFHVHFFGLPHFLGLRGKVALGFVIGIFIPVMGLCITTGFYLAAQQESIPSDMAEHMIRKLDSLDLGILSEENRWQERLGKSKKALSAVIDGPEKGLQTVVKKMLKNDIGRTFWIFHVDGRMWTFTDFEDQVTPKRLAPFFQGYSIEVMQKMGIFAPADGSDPFALKYQSLIGVAQSVGEKLFDAQMIQKVLANCGQVYAPPVGFTHQAVAGFPVLDAAGKNIRALVFLLRTDGNWIEPYLKKVFQKKFDLFEMVEGFAIQYFFYGIEAEPPPEILMNIYQNNLDLAQQLLPNVFLCILDKVGKIHDDLSGSEPSLAVSKVFSNSNSIGLAHATIPRSKWTEMLLLPLGLFASILGLWSGVTLVAVYFLTWPFPALVRAMKTTADGHFHWRLDLSRHDEFGELAQVFNNMARGLQEKAKMSRFVSDEVLQTVSSQESHEKRGGEQPSGEFAANPGKRPESVPAWGTKDSSILFSDIRGFTTLAESHSPEAIVSMLNDYFTSMEACIKAEHGTINSLIGDAILAVFPHRDDLEANALRAGRAAVAMKLALAQLNDDRRKQELFCIDNGIGIASGLCLGGQVGSEKGRRVHMIMGTPVDEATRLESLTRKPSSSGILIDRATEAFAGSGLNVRQIVHQGSAETQGVFEILP